MGVRPAKPSIDNPTDPGTPVNPEIFEGMQAKNTYRFHPVGGDVYAETIKPQGPIPGVCEQDPCEVVAIHTVDTDHVGLENVDMISSDGTLLCSLRLNNGQVVANDCGWYR